MGSFSPDDGWTIPHLAAGGGFAATLQVLNLAARPARVQIRFFDDLGRPLPLPAGTGDTFGFSGDLPAGGRCDVSITDGGPNIRSGYARIRSAPPNSIAVTALLRRKLAEGPESYAALPPGVRWRDRTTTPFLNWNGLVTALAQVNDTPVAQTLRITARDEEGIAVCREAILLAPGQHQAFLLADRLPCTTERRGLLEFEATHPQGLAAAILVFHASGSFTALTPAAAENTLRTPPKK